MLDEKLARGKARDLLRWVKQVTSFDDGPLRPVLVELNALYARSGGPPNVVSTGLALRDRLAAAGPFPTNALVVKHPTRKRVVVESVRPAAIAGTEQEWLACAGSAFDLGRHELGMVETSGHVAISHHALARLHQRGGFSRGRMAELLDVATAFVGPLIQAVARLRWRLGREVAVPFGNGLLLGSIDANFHEEGQGASFTTVSRDGRSEMLLLDCPYTVSAEHRCTLIVSIHTFVGDRDLFPEQQVIRADLLGFQKRFRAEMEAIRTGMLRGYPDPRMVERFGPVTEHLTPGQLVALGETMQRFFDTAEWKRHAEAHNRPKRALN